MFMLDVFTHFNLYSTSSFYPYAEKNLPYSTMDTAWRYVRVGVGAVCFGRKSNIGTICLLCIQ